MSAVTMLMWKGPSIGWADWLFMLRWENEKDLRINRGGGEEYRPLLLFQIHIKEIMVMHTPNQQTLSFRWKFFQSLAQIFSE